MQPGQGEPPNALEILLYMMDKINAFALAFAVCRFSSSRLYSLSFDLILGDSRLTDVVGLIYRFLCEKVLFSSRH